MTDRAQNDEAMGRIKIISSRFHILLEFADFNFQQTSSHFIIFSAFVKPDFLRHVP